MTQHYRILEAWGDNPSQTYTLPEIMELLSEYIQRDVRLEEDGGLKHLVGTAFYVQPVEEDHEWGI